MKLRFWNKTKKLTQFRMTKRYCIYALICPISKQPFYVGYTSNLINRYRHHVSSGANTAVLKYVQNLKSMDKLPRLKKLFFTDNFDEALLKESDYINKYRIKFSLLNIRGQFSPEHLIRRTNKIFLKTKRINN